MPARIRRRWKSKFARFVFAFGTKNLARELAITQDAIYKWVSGSVTPRSSYALIILSLARKRRFRLTIQEIYKHSLTVRAQEIKPETGILPWPKADASSPENGLLKNRFARTSAK